MSLLAFFLESAHGPRARTWREHLGMRRGAYPAPCVRGNALKDVAIGRRYAKRGAARALREAMEGGDKEFRKHRAANWRARFTIAVGEAHAEILEIGVNAKERLLAGIRNRAAQAARAATAERARLDGLFFGLDTDVIEVVFKRPRLALSR